MAHVAARQAHVKVVSELLGAGASASLPRRPDDVYDGLKYVEEVLVEYDRRLGLPARAGGRQ